MITMGSPDDTPEELATTEGRPPAGMEIRVTAPDGTPLPPGTEGQVRLRGEAVCQGYLDEEETSAAFDADGFLITGDLGRVLASGHLVLTGRTKDIVIRKGENISAKEIEHLLYQHPGVADAAVVGLPDAERGERVCAVVEQPAGAPPLTLPEVTAYLREAGLAPYKLPETAGGRRRAAPQRDAAQSAQVQAAGTVRPDQPAGTPPRLSWAGGA
ncbi:hypothetical protein TPA0909_55200 [Streptomyces albus]|nr:hypothetical protein TPA0909_55200 [Streptomyces albus]